MSLRFTLLALTVLACGCNSPKGKPIHRIAAEINATLAPVEEALVPGDRIAVRFLSFSETQLDPSGEFLIPADGRLQLPNIGVLRAAGRTPAQLAELIEEAYKPVFGGTTPAVAVTFLEQVARTFHVIGSVRRTGEYPLDPDGRVTLVEGLARAGGVTYLASYMGNVMLVRWDAGRQRQVAWVIDARSKWWGESETILLQANDIVFVPQTTVANVNDWVERYLIRMIPFPRFFIPAA